MEESAPQHPETARYIKDLNTAVQDIICKEYIKNRGTYSLEGPGETTGWLSYDGRAITVLDITQVITGVRDERILQQTQIIRREDGIYDARLVRLRREAEPIPGDNESLIDVELQYQGRLDEEICKRIHGILNDKDAVSISRIHDAASKRLHKHQPKEHIGIAENKESRDRSRVKKARKASTFVLEALGRISPYAAPFNRP